VGVSPPVQVLEAGRGEPDPVRRALHAVRTLERYLRHAWDPDREKVEAILREVADLLEDAER
jgi:hypothetical protein